MRNETMLYKYTQRLFFLILLFILSCKTMNKIDENSIEFQKENSSISSVDRPLDLVLIYTGGSQRSSGWFKSEHFAPYVSLKREDGTYDWLFDGFLFLEINDSKWSFWGNHGSVPARKGEWSKLVDTFFTPGENIFALEHEIEKIKKIKKDDSFVKRKISIVIPEPKDNQQDWGELGGEKMDFNYIDHQVKSIKWYIDYVLNKIDISSLNNVELVSFYWIVENNPTKIRVTEEIKEYVHGRGYDFYWIPNFLGLEQINRNWKNIGYDRAYIQPGYFYRSDRDSVRLRESCEMVNGYGLNPYVEVDNRALKKNKNWGYRLHKTIDVFDEFGFWDSKAIAYYQGTNTLYSLYHSDEKDDNSLYMRLANIIADRQKRKQEK